MQTLKEVLGRREERQNLQNMVLCILLVLAMMLVSFGIVYVRFFPHKTPVEHREETVTREPRTDL